MCMVREKNAGNLQDSVNAQVVAPQPSPAPKKTLKNIGVRRRNEALAYVETMAGYTEKYSRKKNLNDTGELLTTYIDY